jgi:hypothetical protein
VTVPFFMAAVFVDDLITIADRLDGIGNLK